MILTQGEQKVQSTAQELIQKGYQVIIEPQLSHLPFEMGGYRPDLIASKDDGGLVIEVKTSSKRLSVDRFQSIAEQVASHQGWRFLLITLDDSSEIVFPSNDNEFPSWEDLDSRLSKLNAMVQDELFEPALIFCWSILEAALRKRAFMQHLPIERFPVVKLLNHAYSSGEISMTEYDLFRCCLKLRNKVAHGIFIAVEPELVKSANQTIQELVEKWQGEMVCA